MRLVCFVAIVGVLVAGCGGRLPRINVPKVGSVVGVKDQGKPAELSETKVETQVELPKGSTIVSEASTGRLEFTLPEAAQLTQTVDVVAATTGSVDTAVAQHRITEEKKAGIARTRVYLGFGLMLVGLVLGFGLPPALRWPTVGLKLAAVGAILVFVPDPPTWLIACLVAAALAMVYTFYIKKHADDK